jgi:polysaccharide pyruvyl transferase WcaK-like protein
MEKTHGLGSGDCVLSIGGDILTLDPGPYPKSGKDEKLDYSIRLMNRGCRLVLWGASVGPFDAWPACIPHYQRFLKRLDLITVREPISRAYLESLGVSQNVVEVGDPAFVMEKLDTPGDFPFADAGDPVLGVNLSPLSVNFAYGSDRMAAAMQDQADVLEELIKTLGVRIVLIPHVIAPFSPADDDYAYLRAIHGKLAPLHSGRIALLPPNLGARRTKGVISHCDAVMAARMHCAIAAVSQGVPAVFLSYSAKAAGLARLVYGTDRCCLKMDGNFRGNVTGLLKDILGERRELSAQIARTSSQLRVRATDAAVALRDIVK